MITRAALGVWCDYCKGRYGKDRNGWLLKAQTPAVVTVISTHFAGRSRSYCKACMDEVQAWPDGTPKDVSVARRRTLGLNQYGRGPWKAIFKAELILVLSNNMSATWSPSMLSTHQ